MNQKKRWAALALSVLTCLPLLCGCGSGSGSEKKEQRSLSVCVGAAPDTLDPAFVQGETEKTLVENLYENLMRAGTGDSGETTASPGIARSYDEETNSDGTVTYTFRLRNAKWSDGTAVTADDFVYAWQRLVSPETGSPNAGLLSMVKGYSAVRAGGDPGQLAVTAKNDSTLVVVLTGKYDWFLTGVCTAAATMPLQKEAVEAAQALAAEQNTAAGEGAEPVDWTFDPTALVTDGPYYVSEVETGEYMLATASGSYYGGRDGPAEIKFSFAQTADEAWTLYDAKTVDFVSQLPQAQFEEVTSDKNRADVTELSTYTLLFNGQTEPFNDPLVRQALSLAVDYAAVTAAAGETAFAAAGLVPPGVPGADEESDFRTEGGELIKVGAQEYESRCTQAAELLVQAGYDNGKGLPSLEYLYVDEGTNGAVAQALANCWRKALHVTVTTRAVAAGDLSAALKSRTYTLAGWEVDGMANDAEGFLTQWARASEANVLGYNNSAYDTLLAVIDGADDAAARVACLHDAESLLLEDYALCPLYQTHTAWKLREGLTGLYRDARGWFRFDGVVQAAK